MSLQRTRDYYEGYTHFRFASNFVSIVEYGTPASNILKRTFPSNKRTISMFTVIELEPLQLIHVGTINLEEVNETMNILPTISYINESCSEACR